MRQIILICCIFFMFVLNSHLNAQVIWEEKFNIPDKGYWADESGNLQTDISGIEWSLDVSGSQFVTTGDYAKTVTTSGGRFEVLDSDGDVVWSSPVFDISNYSTVSVSMKVSETGSNTGAVKKYVKANYKLDGILYLFSPDSILSGNWGTKELKVQGIRGHQFQLLITMNSSYSSDKILLDDVLVEGIDSSLFVPEKISLSYTPSFAFSGEETFIKATILNRRGEEIIGNQFDLSFVSAEFEVVTFDFENGIYYWKVKPLKTGIAEFKIYSGNEDLDSISGNVMIYSKENLLLMDDFEDGDLNDWRLDNDWEASDIEPIAGNFSLKHHPETENINSSIINEFPEINLDKGNYLFSFKFKNGEWDPSSSNSFFFAIVNQSIAHYAADGYIVGVNAKGSSDLVSLWSIDNGNVKDLIAETSFDWGENNQAKIDLIRDPKGNWLLSVTDLFTGETVSSEGFNDEFDIVNEIGLNYTYTETRSGQLWFDDLLVFRENTPPFIQNVISSSDGTILVCFSEPVKTENLTVSNFVLKGADELLFEIVSISVISNDTVMLKPAGINEANLIVSAQNIEDLEGAVSSEDQFAFEYQFPASAYKIFISEILFNPKPDGADFVELFNRSGFSVDLSDLYLATRNDTLGIKSVCSVSKSEIEFPDQSYLVFTKDSIGLVSSCVVPYPERIVTMSSFPSFPDEEGNVVLLNRSLDVIDEFAYSDDMHSPLISDKEGVSLERTSFDEETGNPESWHSASSLVGYATPGYENSQPEVIEDPDAISVLLTPDAISPNGDSYNDEMEIQFQLDKPGYLANVFVFDINGRRVCRLLNNDLIGNSTKIVFNGTIDSGNRLPMGFYVLLTELVHPDGEKKVFKQSFLVTDKR